MSSMHSDLTRVRCFVGTLVTCHSYLHENATLYHAASPPSLDCLDCYLADARVSRGCSAQIKRDSR